MMESLYRKIGKPNPEFSRLFVYYTTRVLVELDAPDDDAGCMLRDVMKAIAKYGACFESTWPYIVDMFATQPTSACFAEASHHKAMRYVRAQNLMNIKCVLAMGYTLVGGFSVPESMMSNDTAATGIVKMPMPDEPFVGGHAILFVGYDDKTGYLMFQNSWGEGWGNKGFGYLPYDYVNTGLADDFWVLKNEAMFSG